MGHHATRASFWIGPRSGDGKEFPARQRIKREIGIKLKPEDRAPDRSLNRCKVGIAFSGTMLAAICP